MSACLFKILSVCLFVSLSVFILVRLYFCLSIYPSIYLSVCLSVQILIGQSFPTLLMAGEIPSIYMSVCVFACQSVRQLVCLSDRLSASSFLYSFLCLLVSLIFCFPSDMVLLLLLKRTWAAHEHHMVTWSSQATQATQATPYRNTSPTSVHVMHRLRVVLTTFTFQSYTTISFVGQQSRELPCPCRITSYLIIIVDYYVSVNY